jgi:hypothetical protein
LFKRGPESRAVEEDEDGQPISGESCSSLFRSLILFKLFTDRAVADDRADDRTVADRDGGREDVDDEETDPLEAGFSGRLMKSSLKMVANDLGYFKCYQIVFIFHF